MRPLTPLVWVATLTALLGVLTVLQLIPSYLLDTTLGHGQSANKAISCVRVILQQGEATDSVLKPS